MVVARDADDAELAAFVRSGRLPPVLALTPSQMEHVRGGRLDVAVVRGVMPEAVLSVWLDGDRPR